MITSFHTPPLANRLRQGPGVDIFKLAPDRHSSGNSGHGNTLPLQEFTEIVGGRFALVGEICGEHNFANFASDDPLEQILDRQIPRTKAIERRDSPLEDVIHAVKRVGLLHHIEVHRRFDDAQDRRVALCRFAPAANFVLGEVVTQPAMPEAAQCVAENARKPRRAGAVMLEQVIRHSLRRFWADARQATKRLDERLNRGTVTQNGSFIPGGRLRPLVNAAMRSLDSASARRRPSL